jgi:hypothetical protein
VLKLDLNEIYERCAVLFLSKTEVWTLFFSFLYFKIYK